jgi:hypothetical protein
MAHSLRKPVHWLTLGTLVALVGAVWIGTRFEAFAADSDSKGTAPMIAHNVYFKLKDASPEAQQKLVEACKAYLTGHPGEVLFAAGTVSELDRPVNDRDWHVGLHLVFKDKAAHDQYQTAPRHEQFIAENKTNWDVVRVFDTNLDGGVQQ